VKPKSISASRTVPIWLRCIAGPLLVTLLGASRLLAQSEPVVGVDITQVTVLSGQGSVLGVTLTNSGFGYVTAPLVTFSGGGGAGATATATISPSGFVTGITLTSGGSGYTSLPTVAIDPPPAPTQAVVTATYSGAGGVLTSSDFVITNQGSGYSTAPTITITGGGATTNATATATLTAGKVTAINVVSGGAGYTGASPITVAVSAPPTSASGATAVATQIGTVFSSPNESYGPFGTAIQITAVGKGTFLQTSFTYKAFVNGTPIGQSSAPVPPPNAFTIPWTPPQPGAYQLTMSITDGTNTAASLPVRYFATGTAIIGPVDGTIVPNGSSVVIQATATPAPLGPDAFVQRVEFWIDGQLQGTDVTYPYAMIYTPATNTSTHTIVAKAYDNLGNLVTPTASRSLRMVTPVGTPPTVRLLNPLSGSSTSAGSTVNLIADATSATGFIKNVDFFVNGVALASSQTFPFTSTWKSTVPGKYDFVAIASDDKGNTVASAPVSVTVTGGFPTVAVTSPPSTGATVIQGTKMTVAVNAGGADGGITSLSKLDLLVDGIVSDTLPKNPNNLVPAPPLTEPFTFDWKSNVSLGAHKLAARVTDINGLIITSSEIPINVIADQPPQISLTNPTDGGSSAVNAPVTITANASDPDNPVSGVEFFVNGASLGAPVTTATNGAYKFSWTPSAAGSYTLTAKVTDDAGATTTSAPVTITVDPAATGGGGSNTVYRGDYGSSTEAGHFALGVNRNGRGTFVAFSTSPAGKTYLWTDIPLNADGTFTAKDANGVTVTGQIGSTGVVGSFGDKTFIGPITVGSNTALILSGTLTGNANSSVIAIVGADNGITLYTASGTNRDAGVGTIGTAGTYTATTPNGGSYSGVVTASTNVVSGNATGGTSGSFVLKEVPSRLINLSTRALAGTAERTLIAGFMVSGSGTKSLLVRGVGPTLSNFGVANPLTNPTVTVVKTSNNSILATNDDWSDLATLRNLAAQVGAFPLNASSKDAALQVSLAPGMYSAIVGGGSTTPAAAMIELYDSDSTTSIPTARLTNLSARALLSSGDTIIAGFVITGDQRKKLLIRAVGPTLANFGIANVLTDPKLDIVSGTTVVSSNDNWSGGATGTIATTSAAVGAFALVPGSLDAATIVQLSPGTYTVQASGVGGAAGVVLLEIYDADP
jgi:hypothetical protein